MDQSTFSLSKESRLTTEWLPIWKSTLLILTHQYWQNVLKAAKQQHYCKLYSLFIGPSSEYFNGHYTANKDNKRNTQVHPHNWISLQSFSSVHWLTLWAFPADKPNGVACHWQAKGQRCCEHGHPIRGIAAQTGNWLILTFLMQQRKVWINGFIKVTWLGTVPIGPQSAKRMWMWICNPLLNKL